MSAPVRNSCHHAGDVAAYAVQALSGTEVAAVEAHLATCADCQRELDMLQPVLQDFAAWPADLLRPDGRLQARLAQRLAEDTGQQLVPPPPRQYREPDWNEVAPGISVKLLAMDHERHMVSMLVRLVPGGEYPPHRHAAIEELHLLDGELWIDERKLYPGDYNRAEPGTGDRRVWSETGCTCVLVTSTLDVLG